MNVLIVGSGGREHAIAFRIKQCASLFNLYILPGNPGTAFLGENVDISVSSHEEILTFCNEKAIDLAVIGPEQPLVDGLGGFLRENNINVFGPSKDAAKIEASKSFAKEIMKEAEVPTAGYIEFSAKNYNLAKEYLNTKKYPSVIKVDGLAAGKGVFVCESPAEAEQALNTIFLDRAFGKSGEKLLVEEYLEGEEASVFAICDGENFVCLPASQDHKRIGDNDTGKNTGGMGAYAPAPIVTPKIFEEIKNRIISPTLKILKKKDKPFIGCLYVGLMITEKGPKVVEFNCRFGDPEAQVVLPLVEGDFLKLLYSAATGDLNKNIVSYNGGSSVCVVAASKGYPDDYKKGFEITGLDEIPLDIIMYHAGTEDVNGKILTDGGRVLGVTSVISELNLKLAKDKAYNAIGKINFENIYYRKDIGDKAFK